MKIKTSHLNISIFKSDPKPLLFHDEPKFHNTPVKNDGKPNSNGETSVLPVYIVI